MSEMDSLLRALTQGDLVSGAVIRGSGEVHCHAAAASIVECAERVCNQLGADLVLIGAEDRGARHGALFVHYLFAHAHKHWLVNVSVPVDGSSPTVPSLAPYLFPASRFEREIRDQFGIQFSGHPDPRPLVRHAFWPEDYHPLLRSEGAREGFADDGRPFPFMPVGGEGVYEIPVGPVHAGVIEPGHFRFSVLGETIITMKSRLYFTHKGTEKLFEGRTPIDGVELAERVSGDTSVGHALAYAQGVEGATGTSIPARARMVRVILLELERLYNHVADVGAIANDTGFAIAHAHCLRIRERLLRLNKALTGSRLMRGVIVPGGLARDFPAGVDAVREVYAVLADFNEVAALCMENTLLEDRLEHTGVLDANAAREYGVLGVIARASGIDIDARRDHPFAAYGELPLEVPVRPQGDVKARTVVRIEEISQSVALIARAWAALPDGPLAAPLGRPDPYRPAFGIVEGWRGRIVHMVIFDAEGRLHRVKIVDPSFFNWPALSRALVNAIVPDFPLCNKSFNQSYSGNDL